MQPPPVVTSSPRTRQTQTFFVIATIIALCVAVLYIDQRLFQSLPHLRTSRRHGGTHFSYQPDEGDGTDGIDETVSTSRQHASTSDSVERKRSGQDASSLRQDEMILREVDGLRNEQVVLIVTSSLAKVSACDDRMTV